ncbi:MAG: carboxypeptidase regulatory-like domain-containing protein, partial [Candidatus Acidiferrales bacterium]
MLSLLAPRATNADELYSRIRGTVIDATGASVPDVVVTATNTATGVTKSFTTGPDGSFDMLDLATGPYKVTAAKANFKTFTATGIQLSVNQPYVLTIKMELGAVTQQVMVEASALQVETTSMQLGYTLDGKTITDMPLNGRNWIQLQQLQPGVVAQSDRFGSNFATNGSQSQQNSYLINGTDSNDLPLNSPLVIPSPDAISEFQLITNTINPEYGRNSGGILNAVIKSGTNHFHGDGFDFYRDTSMNARTFFQKTPTVFHQNQFGGTIGGPVWKDHLFGFFSYQGTRARQPSPNATGTTTVFTAAQRAGNFGSFPQNPNTTSPTSTTRTSFIPLFGDASSPCPVSGGVRCPTGIPYHSFTDKLGGFHPGLFDTGVIPSQNFNPLSVNLINTFVPLPNLGANGFTFQPTRTNSIDQYLYRVDHTFNQHDSIWFYSFIQTNPVSDPVPFTGATVPGFPQVSKSHIKQYTAAWTHTFNGSTLNELRFGYTRLNFDAVEPTSPVLPSSLGWNI